MATLLRPIVADGFSYKAREFNSSNRQGNDLPTMEVLFDDNHVIRTDKEVVVWVVISPDGFGIQ